MGDWIILLSAVCCGIAAGCLAGFLMNAMRQIEFSGNAVNAEVINSLPVLIRFAVPFLPMVKPLARHKAFASVREAAESRLAMAGYSDSVTPEDFTGLRIFFIFLASAMTVFSFFAGATLFGAVVGLLVSIYPNVWLNTRIARRHTEILRALPNLLDLLTLSVEAGKDFMSSLRDILQRRKMDALGEEWMRTFQEIQLGRKRTDALHDLSRRVGQQDLTSVVNAVIQAEELGVSIGQLLKIQGDMLRNKRFSLAEKLANEAPVKIIVPIVLFIFPAVMLILIVPIGLKIFQLS